MATISALVVELSLQAENFNNGLRNAQREAKELEKSVRPTQKLMSDVGDTMTGVGVAISAIGVPFAMAAKSAIDTAEAFYDMSQRTGATTEALSSVSFMAKEAGAGAEAVEMAFKKSSKVMEDAATGNKSAAETLAKLGLSVDALMKMSPDERFFAMAKGLDSIKDSSMKSAVAQEIYGKSGTDLIPILGDLAKGQQSVTDNANKFGQVVTGKAAQSANDFNDSISRLTASLSGVIKAMVDSGLLDTIAQFANRMALLIGEFTKAHPIIVTVGAVIGGLSAVVGPILAAVGLMVTGVSSLIPLIVSVGGAIAGSAGVTAAVSGLVAILTGPVGVVIAIVAATAALSKFVMNNETLVKILDPIWTTIGNAINSTVDFIIKLWDDMWKFILEAPKRAKDAILGTVKGVTDGVTGFFKGMYEAVVGHSYVPDMLDRIQQEFNRLPSVMEAPVIRSTMGVVGAFSDMFDTISSSSANWGQKMGSIFSTVGGTMKGMANGNGSSMFGMGSLIGGLAGPIGFGWDLGTMIAGWLGIGGPSKEEEERQKWLDANPGGKIYTNGNRLTAEQIAQADSTRPNPGQPNIFGSPYSNGYIPGLGTPGAAYSGSGGGSTINIQNLIVNGAVGGYTDIARVIGIELNNLTRNEGLVIQGAR